MTNWINIDFDSSDSNDQTNDNGDSSFNWAFNGNDLPDDWMNAPDPEEEFRKKKEEEERIKNEKENAADAEKKRKRAIREEKRKKKELHFDFDNENNYETSFFEVAKEQKEISELQDAVNAFGGLDMSIKDIDSIDIGDYIPETVVQFNAYAATIVKKINQIFPEIKQAGKNKKEYEQLKSTQDNNKVKMIEYIINALCDNYKSASLANLDSYITDLYNTKLDEYKKSKGYKKKSKNKTHNFFNAAQEEAKFDEIE